MDIATQKLSCIGDWRAPTMKYDRCVIDASDLESAVFLNSKGYVFVDRTIQVTVNLSRVGNLDKLCRIPLEHLNEPVDRIYEIAAESFGLDSRFFVTMPPTVETMSRLIREYVDEMKGVYVCRYKEKIIGFIEVVDSTAGEEAVIRFAAVDALYRRTGAAMSLYAGVVGRYKDDGYKRLSGRISGRNMSVMNVYATLKASFSMPEDVYVKI